MSNPNKTNLDANQTTVNAYDGVEEAQRVTIVSSTEYAVSVSESSGDSVVSYNETTQSLSLVVMPAGGSPAISAALPCYRFSTCSVYSDIADSPVTPGSVKIQVSHKDTGNAANDWHDLSPAILAGYSPQGTNLYPAQNTGLSPTFSFCARRIRLVSVQRPSVAIVTYTILLRT